MFDSLHKPYANTLGPAPEPQLGKRASKQPMVLSPRFQRIIVVGPTVVLSMWLSSCPV